MVPTYCPWIQKTEILKYSLANICRVCYIFFAVLNICACGEIGRHVGFRFQFQKSAGSSPVRRTKKVQQPCGCCAFLCKRQKKQTTGRRFWRSVVCFYAGIKPSDSMYALAASCRSQGATLFATTKRANSSA